MPKPCSGTQALGFKTDSEEIAALRKIHAVQIYDRIYGSKAIASDPPNSFSLYSLFYTHTVHGYAQVHASIYIYIYIYIFSVITFPSACEGKCNRTLILYEQITNIYLFTICLK